MILGINLQKMLKSTLYTVSEFQVSIQPFEKRALPDDAILGFHNPVAFVGEVEKATWDSEQLRSLKSLDAFTDGYPKIEFSMNDEDGSIPVFDVSVRGVAEVSGGKLNSQFYLQIRFGIARQRGSKGTG